MTTKRPDGLRTTLLLVAICGLLVPFQGERAGAQATNPAGRILFVRDGDVWLWSAGEARELFAHGTASDPRWSPDGRQVLYVANHESYADLVLSDLATGREQQLTDSQPPADLEPGSELYVNRSSWVRDPSWSTSGRIAFIADFEEDGRMALWLMEVPGATATLAPELEPEEIDIEGVDLSQSGVLAAYTVKNFDGVVYHTSVSLRDLSDGAVYPIADEPGGAYDPAISPDEQWFAMTIRAENGVSDLWLASRSDGSLEQLTFGVQAVAATWSPDGTWLAYLRPNGDGFELWALPMAVGRAAGDPVKLGDWDGLDATSGLSWMLAG